MQLYCRGNYSHWHRDFEMAILYHLGKQTHSTQTFSGRVLMNNRWFSIFLSYHWCTSCTLRLLDGLWKTSTPTTVHHRLYWYSETKKSRQANDQLIFSRMSKKRFVDQAQQTQKLLDEQAEFQPQDETVCTELDVLREWTTRRRSTEVVSHAGSRRTLEGSDSELR